jgi:hypothetical protein
VFDMPRDGARAEKSQLPAPLEHNVQPIHHRHT